MGSSSAWIAGSYQSDFARNYAREGLEISDMVAEAVEGTLHSAGVEPEDVGVDPRRERVRPAVHRTGAAGRDARHRRARLWGKPAARHEAACASGASRS